tara:strand:- start:622 stop:1026 length:405 start_codon:yes stop_codon:yes gene_type:complete
LNYTGITLAALLFVFSTQANTQSEPTNLAQLSTDDDTIIFGVEDIAGVDVGAGEERSTITLSLNDNASDVLAELTGRNLRREMRFSVCEKEVFRVTINATVTSGIIRATSERAAALAMSNVLTGQTDCAEYLRQ